MVLSTNSMLEIHDIWAPEMTGQPCTLQVPNRSRQIYRVDQKVSGAELIEEELTEEEFTEEDPV